jgi:2-iminobutanoate/2-iminopropanoate deaminase
MNRRAVSSDQAPKALGPCSQAIVAGGLVFCSGMAGTDPASGTIPRGSKPRPSGRCSALPPCSSPPGRRWRTSSRRRSSTPTPRTSAGSTRSTPGICPILRPPGLPRADVRLPLGLLVSIEAMAVLPGASALLGGVRDGAGHRSSPALSRRREAGQRRTPTASLLLATSAPVAVPERPGVRASAGRTPVLKRPSMLPIAMRPHARRSVTAQCSFYERLSGLAVSSGRFKTIHGWVRISSGVIVGRCCCCRRHWRIGLRMIIWFGRFWGRLIR